MAEKKIQARIRQKVDTKANWDKATNFVPLKGEYIYYSDLHKVKVGDGTTKVGALPFLADSDTHSITGMYIGATNAKANAATTNGNTYLKLYDDNTKRAEFKIVGSGATKVSSDANGNITISSTDTNTHQSVADKNPTLAWGAKSTVATIGSTDIHVTMPANPNTDTHFTTGLYVGKANEKSNSATTNGNTYLKLFDNDTKRSQHLIHGTGLTTVASDASGTITINSTLPTNLVTTAQLANKLDKNNASGTGSFTWTNTEKGKPLDIKFVATTDQSGVDIMGFNATDTLATLTGSAYMGNTKFTLTSGYSDGDGPSIVINNNGYETTITANGINVDNNGQIQWPMSGGRFVTSGDFANENATDPSANQGKIPKLEYPGTIPLKFIKPMVSMYASENDLPGAVHFSPYYVPDALYVTTDTNSIYRYNKDTESYVKLGPDTSKFLDKGTSSTVVNQVVYNPVEMKKALTVPSVQGTKYTDNSGNQQPLFTLGGTASGSGNTSQASSSLTLYRNRAGSWDSATISFAPVDGLKIGNYAVGVQDWNRIPASYILTNGDGVTKDINGGVKLKSSGGAASDDFVFESTNNGKLHSKMSVGPSGLVRGGWCIDNSKIITEATIRSVVDAISTESILSICI